MGLEPTTFCLGSIFNGFRGECRPFPQEPGNPPQINQLLPNQCHTVPSEYALFPLL